MPVRFCSATSRSAYGLRSVNRAGLPGGASRPTPRSCPRPAAGRCGRGRRCRNGGRTPGRGPASRRSACGRPSPRTRGSGPTGPPARPAFWAGLRGRRGRPRAAGPGRRAGRPRTSQPSASKPVVPSSACPSSIAARSALERPLTPRSSHRRPSVETTTTLPHRRGDPSGPSNSRSSPQHGALDQRGERVGGDDAERPALLQRLGEGLADAVEGPRPRSPPPAGRRSPGRRASAWRAWGSGGSRPRPSAPPTTPDRGCRGRPGPSRAGPAGRRGRRRSPRRARPRRTAGTTGAGHAASPRGRRFWASPAALGGRSSRPAMRRCWSKSVHPGRITATSVIARPPPASRAEPASRARSAIAVA